MLSTCKQEPFLLHVLFFCPFEAKDILGIQVVLSVCAQCKIRLGFNLRQLFNTELPPLKGIVCRAVKDVPDNKC